MIEESTTQNQKINKNYDRTMKDIDDEAERHAHSNFDLYEVLEVNRTAQIQEIKASYYRLALIHHPDRTENTDKTIAMDKFNVLHLAYSILSNPQTKTLYDKGESNMTLGNTTPAEKWSQYLRIVNSTDIGCARQKYQGSAKEESDILREFVIGNGSITHLFNVIPFMRFEDESRIIQIVKKCIEIGKLPKISIKKIRH